MPHYTHWLINIFLTYVSQHLTFIKSEKHGISLNNGPALMMDD